MQIPSRLPLVVSTANRDSSDKKDARLVNCYMETDKLTGDISIRKRPGLFDAGNPPTTAAEGLGVYFWDGAVYAIFGGVLYRDGVSVATGMSTSGGVYSFSQLRGGNPKLLMQNGAAGYTYDTVHGLSAPLHSIDADYPEFTTKGWAYLNGASYVMQNFFGTSPTAATIWGSVVNSVDQPGDWDPLDFITAQIEPDQGVFLTKQLVYVIALKQWSTEVVFDAGNATGSPLANVQGSKQSYGCVNGDSVQRIDDVLFWLSTNEAAQYQVVMMARLTLAVISTPPIDRLLRDISISERTVHSWQLKVDGHSFYMLTLVGLNLTLAYDITEGRWHQWTDSNGDYFPIVASTYDALGRHILQHESDGHLYYCSSAYFKDGPTQPIQLDIYTPVFDANTRRRKMCSNLEIVGDQQEGSLLEVSWSDDDYQTWTSPRIAHLGQRRPIMPDLGTFVKRSFNFRHTQDLPFRISAVELQYDLGTL
jgi:hypothetical protein